MKGIGPLVRRLTFGALAAVSAVGLTSCGGGTLASVGGGTGGTGIVFGAVTGFGSVIVKGVEFDVSAATFSDDGAQRSDDSFLRVGMVVKVVGTIGANGSAGSASSVTFNTDFSGPVSNRDPAANTFEVLGQTVQVSASTVFDGISFATLQDGNVVDVSGFRDASGTLVASWVGLVSATLQSGATVEVQGTVTAVTPGVAFQIGSLTVNYAGSVAQGSFVDVNGTFDSGTGTLTAQSVQALKTGLGTKEGDDVEVEGFIDRFTSASDFTVAGQAVATNAGTQYVNGTAADLALNKKVEVEGSVGANGVLLASTVKFAPLTKWQIDATVDAADAATDALQFFNGSGTPVTVYAAADASYGDESFEDMRPFAFADIHAGDYLEVRGYTAAGTGRLVATQVLRQDPQTACELKGPVTSVDQPNTQFVMLGVTADTDSVTTKFLSADETSESSGQFYNSLQVADTVSATWSGCVLSAPPDKVEKHNNEGE